jgi:adenosylcobinamide-phosphate synthase
VRGIGFAITCFEKMLKKLFKLGDEREEDKTKKLIAGAVLAIAVIFVSTAIPLAILYVAGCINYYFKVVLEIIMCYQLLAMKSLKTESMKVYTAMKSGDVEKARYAVSMIVGRDTKVLTKEGIIKAAVETVAENTSDGVIAPLFYIMLFGAAGGFLYKAVNTMDSMIGYKNDKYIYFGRTAAKLDDVLNFVPSRLSAVFMILASAVLNLNFKNAIHVYKRDRFNHASPNSAQTEAVCAGALSVRLAGDAWYFGKLCKKPFIGDDIRPIENEDIKRANDLLYAASILTLILGVCVMLILEMLL